MAEMNRHATVARAMICVVSGWTAGLQLLSTSSLAYRAAGGSLVIDAINVIVLALVALAVSDICWHDILKRGLVLPSVPDRLRHQVCVWTYSAMAAAFSIRAFLAAGDPSSVFQVGGYYVLVSLAIAYEAHALAHEERAGSCQSE